MIAIADFDLTQKYCRVFANNNKNIYTAQKVKKYSQEYGQML